MGGTEQRDGLRLTLRMTRYRMETPPGSKRRWGKALHFHRQREQRICKLEDQNSKVCATGSQEGKLHLEFGETEAESKGLGRWTMKKHEAFFPRAPILKRTIPHPGGISQSPFFSALCQKPRPQGFQKQRDGPKFGLGEGIGPFLRPSPKAIPVAMVVS